VSIINDSHFKNASLKLRIEELRRRKMKYIKIGVGVLECWRVGVLDLIQA
jgi:hypothetical protein